MFAITTRNKLRGRRFAPLMLLAWFRIRRQLSRTPGMLAYTTGMASATEFVTLTLWEKEIDMMAFMSSDDHRDMMWNVRHWSDSFWSMRWKPTIEEHGSWYNSTFAIGTPPGEGQSSYVGPGYLQAHQVPEKLRPILSNIIRSSEPDILNINAVICRIPTSSPGKILRLGRLVKPLRNEPDVIRSSLAVGLGECMLLVIWKTPSNQRANSLMNAVFNGFPDCWAMRFQATDFEIGHWDQLRFREMNVADQRMA